MYNTVLLTIGTVHHGESAAFMHLVDVYISIYLKLCAV